MEKNIEKKIITIVFLLTVFAGNFCSNAYSLVDEFIISVQADVRTEWNVKRAKKQEKSPMDITEIADLRARDIEGNDIPTYSALTSKYLSEFPFKQKMIEFNSTLAKRLNMREIYKNNGGIVLKNGYIVGIYPYTSTDYEIRQISEFKSYLDEKGVQLLYVNEPTKYIDDCVIVDDLGLATYINNNADRFLNGLDEYGIQYIDLRDNIRDEQLDSFNLFYKTDHHWTTKAGKMAAEAIARELNTDFEYNIDLSLYASDQFNYKEYKNAWLGEQGKKLGASFVGLDDFTLILPDYDTSFIVSCGTNVVSGSFSETLVYQAQYLPENNEDIYQARSWHYSYMGPSAIKEIKVENAKNTEGKKILVLGDSYEQVTVPFLALGVSEVQCLVLRAYGGSLREYIENHDIDTVVIAYAAFMIGAHDNELSANYAMFDFNK